MDATTILAVIVAVIWGAMWAAFLEFNRHGRFIAARMTWLSVVIGVGMDLVILLAVLPFDLWLRMFGVVSASSVCIIGRSVINESRDSHRLLTMKNERSESTH